MYKEIVQKIIDLLSADPALAKPSVIREYYFGRPAKLRRFPCIYVEFEGGPIASMGIGGASKRKDHNYRITVTHRLTKEDVAEKFVLDKAEAIETNVKTNKTLEGAVISAVVVDTHRVDEPLDYSLKQIRVTVKTFKQVT